MKTRITELFGIQYPIILSGMSWISVPKLVAAVCNAGGLGILATVPLTPEETRKAIREIRTLTDKPFGCNTALNLPAGAKNTKVLLEEQVPVVNFALGKADWLVKSVHAYGGKVVATVVTTHHAQRAQDYGSDAVIATGHEAAAHGHILPTLIVVPTLVDQLKIPVIAAGGIGDGRGMAAALALGAEGIAMGTRFMTTKESPLNDVYKKLSLEKTAEDTLFSDRFDGLFCRVMKTDAAARALKKGFSIPEAIAGSRDAAKQINAPFFKMFGAVMASGLKNARQLAHFAQAFPAFKAATEDGDTSMGLLPVGMTLGMIKDEPTVAEVFERIIAEAKSAKQKLSEKLS